MASVSNLVGPSRSTASGPASVAAKRIRGNVTTHNTTVVQHGAVPLIVAKQDPAAVFAAVDIDRFVGREWLAEEVDHFLASHTSGFILLEAEAGVGKTAFAAWLVKTRGYPAHFSRLGRSVGVALRNLSAQLISVADLGPEDGIDHRAIVPDWASTSEGFAFLASRAASHLTQPVVIVVDGLDEAEETSSGLPFGLPEVVPPDVFIIGTSRTGHSPRHLPSPSIVLRIERDDPRNESDIHAYLESELTKGELAVQVTEANIPGEEIIAVLTDRCSGLWVYLTSVLSGLTIGLRAIQDLPDLPKSLIEYYAEQLSSNPDPSWQTFNVPVLGTLAAVNETLTIESLGRLAGIEDIAALHRMCDYEYRPLLTVITSRGEPRRYSIYHSSLREFLNQGSIESDQHLIRDSVLALGSQLAEATRAAHHRIADYYLAAFGNLSTGMASLAANPDLATLDNGYGLRNLVFHLEATGRQEDIDQVLRCGSLAQSQSGDENKQVNVWYRAHASAGTIDEFLEDIQIARSLAERKVDCQLKSGSSPASLDNELRYALVAATVDSVANNVPVVFLNQLVRSGRWGLARALAHARRYIDPATRIEALRCLAAAADGLRPDILTEALTSAEAITDEITRAEVLASLAASLETHQIERLLACARDLHDDDSKAHLLAEIAKRATEEQIESVLEIAESISSVQTRVPIFTAMFEHTSSTDRPDILNAILTDVACSTRQDVKGDLLIQLVPVLNIQQLQRALEIASNISSAEWRARAATSLAPKLPGTLKRQALDQALDAAAEVALEASKLTLILTLVKLIDKVQIPHLWIVAKTLNGEYYRAQAIAGLGPFLDSSLLREAQGLANLMDSDYAKALALAGLAPCLATSEQEDALQIAVETAKNVASDDLRARALINIYIHTKSELRAAIIGDAFNAFAGITGDGVKLEILIAAIPHLDQKLIPRAVSLAQSLEDEESRAKALAALAFRLDSTLIKVALADAAALSRPDERAIALSALAAHLDAAQLEQALYASEMLDDRPARISAMIGLGNQLNPECRTDVLERAIDQTAEITDQARRALAYQGLSPYISSSQVPRIIAGVSELPSAALRVDTLAKLVVCMRTNARLAVIELLLQREFKSATDYDQAKALARVATFLSDEQLDRALDIVEGFESEDARVCALLAIARSLNNRQMCRAFEMAVANSRQKARAAALAGLCNFLAPSELDRAASVADELTDAESRCEVLTAIARRLPASERHDVLHRAIQSAQSIRGEASQVETLVTLIPHLSLSQIYGVLSILPSLSPEAKVRLASAAAGPPPFRYGLIAYALQTAKSIRSNYYLTRALANITAQLRVPDDAQTASRVLEIAQTITDIHYRLCAVTDLLRHIESQSRSVLIEQAMTDCLSLNDEEARVRVILNLSHHITPGQIDIAIDIIEDLNSDVARNMAIVGLASRMNDEQLLRVGELCSRLQGDAAAAVLRSIHTSSLPALSGTRLLRSLFRGRSRYQCLDLLSAAAPMIKQIGGSPAVVGCLEAIDDVFSWWS